MTEKPSQRRALAVAVVIPVVVLTVYMMRQMLASIALGVLFAVVLYPLFVKLRRKLGKRAGWAPALMTIGSMLTLVAPLVFIGAMAVQTGSKIIDSLKSLPKGTVQSKLTSFGHTFDRFTTKFGLDYDHSDLLNAASEAGEKALTWLGATAGEFAASAPDLMLSTLMFVLSLYFTLSDGERAKAWVDDLLPFEETDRLKLWASLNDTINDVMLGSIFTGFVQALLVLLSTAALSVPGPFLLFAAAFILSFLPIVGTVPITAGATVYLFIQSEIVKGIIMGVAGLVIGVSDNVVRPLVSARSGNMHPLLMLAAIFGGLQTFGSSGVFLGPVIAAVAVWGLDLHSRRRIAPIADGT